MTFLCIDIYLIFCFLKNYSVITFCSNLKYLKNGMNKVDSRTSTMILVKK